MARRKTHRRRSSSHRRRGRVGGILSQDRIMKSVGAVVGVIATGFINKQFGEVDAATGKPKIDPKLLALGEVLVGFMLPNFVKGSLVEGVGLGMVAAGGYNAAKDMGIVSGLPIVGGYEHLRIVNGIPPQVQKFVPSADRSRMTASQVITGVMNSNYSNG